MSEIHPEIAGNWKDDDAEYMDDLIESVPTPPTVVDMPTEETDLPAASVPLGANRLMSRHMKFTGVPPTPVLVLPPDPERKELSIYANDSTVHIADNPNYLANPATLGLSFQLRSDSVFALSGYTGPIYAVPYAAADASYEWTVCAVAVTR